MATRMQQRRGTAAQWSGANPILAVAEIGYESDTGKFKIGDGVNHWNDLIYYTSNSDLASLIDGAPELLNTINELAAAIADDPGFANTVLMSVDAAQAAAQGYSEQLIANSIAAHNALSTNIHGIADTFALATKEYADDSSDAAMIAHNAVSTNVHGIADTTLLATKSYADNAALEAKANAEATADTALDTHGSTTTNVHGIADTSALATKTYADGAASNAQAAAESTASSALSSHESDTTDVHGIANTAALATKSYADGKASDAQSAAESTAANALASHEADTTNVHGIADTSLLATKSYADSAVSTHLVVTTNVHGIADTAALATKTYADGAAANAVSTHEADTTNVHGIADTSKIVLTDANTQTISGSLTITGDLTVQGNTLTVSANSLVINDPMIYMGENNTGNSVDLGIVSSYTSGNTYVHTGLVRDASDTKWKLFTGVTDEPTTTINFAQGSLDALAVGPLEASSLTVGNVSNTEIGYLDGVTSAIQTQLDAKAPSSSPTLATPTVTGALTLSSSGVIFTDGTQTKEGVPSRTPIVQKTASYTLSALTERDSLIEISSASAVTLTVPANSSVAYPVGTSIDILQTGAGQVTVAGAGGVTVNATPGLKLRTQWSGATLFKRATDTWVLYGDLMA